MKLPIKTTVLGDEINIVEAPLEDKLGQWDESTSTITINSEQSEYGKRIILIHEVLHVIETMMIQNEMLDRRVNHEFIQGASFGITALLTASGMLDGLTEKDYFDFIESLPKDSQSQELTEVIATN